MTVSLLAGGSRWSPEAARPVTWMFLAMIVTFLLTRTITRRIRSESSEATAPETGRRRGLGDFTIGGVHLHHQVFGVAIMIGAGLVLIEDNPAGAGLRLAAALFGVGVSLTLDEFALLFYLDDVYWSQEGRTSVDAMFCVIAMTGMLVAGFTFGVHADNPAAFWATLAWHVVGLVTGVLSVLRGKLLTGVVGTFLAPVSVIGALRLAKPGSWWGRHRYSASTLERSKQRFGARYDARWNRLRDLVAGAPTSSP